MIRRSLTALLAITAFAVLSAGRAKADEIFTWTMPASPDTSASGNSFMLGNFFEIAGVPFSENGGAPTMGTVDFFPTSMGGGFELFPFSNSNAILDEGGPQVYTGPMGNEEGAPTFLLGTFGPFTCGTVAVPCGSVGAGLAGTLTISDAGNGNDLFTYDVSNGVPEPSSLLLLCTGALSLLGFARRRLLG